MDSTDVHILLGIIEEVKTQLLVDGFDSGIVHDKLDRVIELLEGGLTDTDDIQQQEFDFYADDGEVDD